MNNYLIPNLVNACEIMKLLSDRPEGILAAEVEALVQVPRTTAFRILKTLCSQDMAEKRGTLFFAGPGLTQIGLNSLRSLEIRSISVPFLSKLATSSGFTAHLAVPNGYQTMILEVHDSPNPVRVASRSGTMVPMHCSSTGKVFLAYRFADNLKDYFTETVPEKFTENTIITLPEIIQEVERIRQQGYAVDNQEFHEEVCCLAAPVRNSNGEIVAAIGVTGPAVNFTPDKQTIVCNLVKEAADGLSAMLGHTH